MLPTRQPPLAPRGHEFPSNIHLGYKSHINCSYNQLQPHTIYDSSCDLHLLQSGNFFDICALTVNNHHHHKITKISCQTHTHPLINHPFLISNITNLSSFSSSFSCSCLCSFNP
ncbi:hypothetical protein QVD17_11497 [Tagetes erecta]|uniref:Uncharacterized protein n=1 Tax=Tagetes erecta TaxID=13708 RepID=A0AAD8KYA7_TARER|nr:hypothetical protein QVD17_11497 [Tagetes erecta]